MINSQALFSFLHHLLVEVLEPGQTSVGTQITVSHVAATPVGGTVKATAKLTAVEKGGRQLTFEIEARDDAEVVGTATHQRFVVTVDKFLAKANSKMQAKTAS